MPTSSFATAVQDTLESLVRDLEATEPDIECDLVDSVLTLTLPDDSQIVLNRQEAVEQIWLACSDGPARFDRVPDQDWKDARSGVGLRSSLAALLSRRLGHPISLEV